VGVYRYGELSECALDEVSKWSWGSYRMDGVTFLKTYIFKYHEDGAVIYEYDKESVFCW